MLPCGFGFSTRKLGCERWLTKLTNIPPLTKAAYPCLSELSPFTESSNLHTQKCFTLDGRTSSASWGKPEMWSSMTSDHDQSYRCQLGNQQLRLSTRFFTLRIQNHSNFKFWRRTADAHTPRKRYIQTAALCCCLALTRIISNIYCSHL